MGLKEKIFSPRNKKFVKKQKNNLLGMATGVGALNLVYAGIMGETAPFEAQMGFIGLSKLVADYESYVRENRRNPDNGLNLWQISRNYFRDELLGNSIELGLVLGGSYFVLPWAGYDSGITEFQPVLGEILTSMVTGAGLSLGAEFLTFYTPPIIRDAGKAADYVDKKVNQPRFE